MTKEKIKYYPTAGEAIHLLVLYIVLQSLIDFPLAMLDYQKDTNYLGNPWISFISNIAIVGFIFWFGYRKANKPFAQVFALKLFNPLIIIPIIIMLPGMQFLVGLLNIEVNKILPAPPWFWELFEKVLNSHFGFWGVLFKVVILAPIIEEILFRGILMHGLMRNYRSWIAILLSGILFALFHLNPWQMTYTFFLGLLLGWLMIRTRSLPLCILAHALNNLIVFLLISFNHKLADNPIMQMQKNESVKLSIAAVFLGVVLIVLITLRKKKRSKASV